MTSLAAHVVGARNANQPPRKSTVERRFRPELQGLRALAVVLVIVYHVWLGRVSGGVDVFFVISGFLVTAQLYRAAERGRIEFRQVWGRMVKRLFPAAMAVLLVITAVGVVVLPKTRWVATIREIGASSLYLENWVLATDSVDYYAQNNRASVVQHFWSLSIQGQFYLVWPLLVGLVALAARRAGRSPHRSLITVQLTVFATSLAYSVWLTRANQPVAYFHSLTRAWEFVLGGLVALGMHTVALRRWHRLALGWLGVLALPVCGVVMRVGSQFPGYLALWPTLCATAVLVAGATGSRWGADRLLGCRPLRYLGDLSYSLYLWHWPVLVFYLVVRERTVVGPRGGAVIIAVSLVLSAATYHLIEQRVRNSQIGIRTRWGAYQLGAATLAAVLLATTAWHLVSTRTAAYYTISLDDPDHPGALMQTDGFEYRGSEHPALVPPLVKVPDDWARVEPASCLNSARNKELQICSTLVPQPPDKRIVLVGDSHIGQWFATFKPIAERHHWQLIVITRGGCPYSAASELVPGDQGCLRWNTDAAAEILTLHPDLVVTLASRDVRAGLTEQTPDGFVDRWRELDHAGIPVLAIRDNPRFGYSPPECITSYGTNAAQCSTPRATLLAANPPYQHIANPPPNVSFLDFSDYYCTHDICPPVIGNVLVYLDNNHTTATFMTTLAPIAEHTITTTLSW